MKKNDFLVFSDDWGEHPSSCQHIFKHIAKDHRVLWVNTIGMRNPSFSRRDLKKMILKIGKMFRPRGEKAAESSQPPVVVCQPPMLPFSNWSFIRSINKFFVVRSVRMQLKKHDFIDPILVTTVPNACDFIGHLGEQRVIYYCVDDFTEWPGLEKTLVVEMERELIEKADAFIATSQKLYDQLNRYGKPTTLLTHGVDLDFFRDLPEDEHPLLADIPTPRIGYFGLFDERSDMELLKAVALLLPDVSFVITGQVEIDISGLTQCSNIFFTGQIPYEELPAMVKGWDACMLLYVINVLTNAIQPLKLKEYLATGRPVLVTPVVEAVKLREYLLVSKSADDFVAHFRTINCEQGDHEEKLLDKFLRQESWSKKSDIFLVVTSC